MSGRDELAKLLGDHESMGCGCCAYGSTTQEQDTAADAMDVSSYMIVLAEAILAAGYRKPRTITTAKELDALPNASLILDALNYCREAAKVSDGNIWRAMGPATVKASREIALPATVLYEPQP